MIVVSLCAEPIHFSSPKRNGVDDIMAAGG